MEEAQCTTDPWSVLDKRVRGPPIANVDSRTGQTALTIHQEPNEGQAQLASQAEDMATMLRSKTPSSFELSEKLYKFAKEVRTLEDRTSHYQFTIQRQQMENNGSAELISRLREEIHALRAEKHQIEMREPSFEIDHDWTIIPKTNSTVERNSDAVLLERIKSLQETNQKLFKANHDWHGKWESLRQSKQQEQDQLKERLAESEALVAALRSQLASMPESSHRDKDKNFSSSPSHDEKDVQVGVMKQQMTLFMQDFEKERRDRQNVNERLSKNIQDQEKMRAKYEQKLNYLQTEIRQKEQQLRAKTAEVEKLRQRVFQLTQRIQNQGSDSKTRTEKMPLVQSPAAENNSSSMMYTSGAGHSLSSLSSSNFAVGPRRRAPEDLPGVWTCQDCTYINYPDRTVCDICGLTNTLDSGRFMSSFGELHSRELTSPPIKPYSIGRNVPDGVGDVEVDSF